MLVVVSFRVSFSMLWIFSVICPLLAYRHYWSYQYSLLGYVSSHPLVRFDPSALRLFLWCTAETFESKCEELKKEHGDKQYIVFYCMYGSLRSPAAALDYIKSLGSQADATNVYVLPLFLNIF